MKPKSVRVFVSDEEDFRNNKDLRDELDGLLGSDIWKMALHIIYNKRLEVERITESLALGSDAVVSVRMNSQRIGMEGLLAALRELTMPLPPPQQADQQSSFGAFDAARKLSELGVTI